MIIDGFAYCVHGLVIGLHLHAVSMTKLINLKQTNVGQATSLKASFMFMIQVRRTCGMERLHYSGCTPLMHAVFSMFETTHMCAMNYSNISRFSYGHISYSYTPNIL